MKKRSVSSYRTAINEYLDKFLKKKRYTGKVEGEESGKKFYVTISEYKAILKTFP